MKKEIFNEKLLYMKRILRYAGNDLNDYKRCLKFIMIFDDLYNEFVTKYLVEFKSGYKRKELYHYNKEILHMRTRILRSCVNYFCQQRDEILRNENIHTRNYDYIFSQIDMYNKYVNQYPSTIPRDVLSAMVEFDKWVYDKTHLQSLEYYTDPATSRPNVFTIKSLMATKDSNEMIYALYPIDKYKNMIQLIRRVCYSNVKDVYLTLYRCGENSSIINLIGFIAEHNPDCKIRIYMELNAYGEYERNSKYLSRLFHYSNVTIFTNSNYKVHAKVLAIKFADDYRLQTLTYISTGNFNGATAKVYEDIGIMSANPDLFNMVEEYYVDNIYLENKGPTYFNAESALENAISYQDEFGYIPEEELEVEEAFKLLYTSPQKISTHEGLSHNISAQIISFIQEQIFDVCANGAAGCIDIKCNSLTDGNIIRNLAKAADNGVVVNCTVRGECLFEHENANVVSQIGSVLLHSRVYQFGEGANKKTIITSADLNEHKLASRHEVGLLIYGESQSLQKLLDLQSQVLNDKFYGWMDWKR